MGDIELDTETKLALVSSLLLQDLAPFVAESDILDALIRNGGNFEAAAKDINSSNNQSPRTSKNNERTSAKRKRLESLSDWLSHSPSGSTTKKLIRDDASIHVTPSRPDLEGASFQTTVANDELRTSSSTSRSPTSATSQVDLMSVLRQAPSSAKKNAPPRLTPLMLSNPSMVAEHSPCTLHPSILPAELACKLFYTMIDESRTWSKNKWWLFDRVVESPHLTSFYARKTDGVDEDVNWQEAARYW
jgi:hypothetical protein